MDDFTVSELNLGRMVGKIADPWLHKEAEKWGLVRNIHYLKVDCYFGLGGDVGVAVDVHI